MYFSFVCEIYSTAATITKLLSNNSENKKKKQYINMLEITKKNNKKINICTTKK